MSDVEVNYYGERFDEEDIETGERYMRSPLTDFWHRVTAWVDKGEGRAVAVEKEQVDRPEVPDRILAADTGTEPAENVNGGNDD